MVNVITGVLGGMYVPLVFMPLGVQKVLNYLPFRFIFDLPARVYIGNIEPLYALKLLGIALLWLVLLIGIGKLLIKLVSRKAIIQGG